MSGRGRSVEQKNNLLLLFDKTDIMDDGDPAVMDEWFQLVNKRTTLLSEQSEVVYV